MEYIEYMTIEGDRWDTIAYKHYGLASHYSPILEANPDIRILPRLPAGVILKIPIIDTSSQVSLEELPPWKR